MTARAPEYFYRLWCEDGADIEGRYLASVETLDEADRLGQSFADYHGATVVAYPPLDRYLIGDRYYAPKGGRS